MLDFVQIRSQTKVMKTSSEIHIYPEFIVCESKDLMIRGGAFYAVWDESLGLWSKNPRTVCEIVDNALRERASEFPEDTQLRVSYLRNYSSKKWSEFLSYCSNMGDNYHELDSKITFLDDEPKKEDYVSKCLPYSKDSGVPEAYDELMSVLYEPIERQKLEWGIGSVFAGESADIQKFFVLYGSSGSGKSTVLHIIEQLFDGYFTVFDSKALGASGNTFSMEMFRNNPLVAIQHDGDLSRIEDNTKLNSIVSHEVMVVNEKRKSQYEMEIRTMIFMGTNKPVKITDAKSGLIRRLVDISPSGKHIEFDRYQMLMYRIGFELGKIAGHCLRVYSRLGRAAYDAYRPVTMLGKTNDFYNFIEDNYEWFVHEDVVGLTEVWEMYKKWAEDTAVPYKLSRRIVKDELMEYFNEFYVRKDIYGEKRRNVYLGFRKDKVFVDPYKDSRDALYAKPTLILDAVKSIFDDEYADAPAQYGNEQGKPRLKWADVHTTLADLDTSELHYVRVPHNHIVIDFDLTDEDGNKDLNANLEAAAKFPPTYAELSQSGYGVHLHYIYDGDPDELARLYSPHIEIKVFRGRSSLRRRLSRCNRRAISHIKSGLPLKKKESGKMMDIDRVKSEKGLRSLIARNLRKEIHPGTKPSIDFIKTILDEAYADGLKYDVSDMKPDIIAFASDSTHHPQYCLHIVQQMHFHSDEPSDPVESIKQIAFYDVEVFPNLFVVVWKFPGKDPVRLINPTPDDIEDLCKLNLVGFNNRRYDNHILYARLLGYNNQELYLVSQNIVNGKRGSMFGEAYNLSYADIYDFSSKKQSLKKFEIDLGIHHQELGLPWDKPVPEDMWGTVADYCVNDVIATEATFNARYDDFVARQILAELSGLTVNDTTRQHATRIIFGRDRNPQSEFNYTDLSEMFPGYSFDAGRSTYRGETVGEGGYVYAETGMYQNVIVLDVASMHPSSILALNLFGDKYTKRFKELMDIRLAIKHHEFDKARSMFDGRLKPYLNNEDEADKLAYALKIVINSIYGFTAARFPCEFKDPRNKDNIVAKRGALFMINLKHEVQQRGFTVAHIKTDSIKIPDATPDIIEFVTEYGKQYGYTFEVENEYDRMCLVNDAVYVAKDAHDGHWSATGAQFQVPYVFKTLFSHEPVEFEDLCMTKSVSGDSVMYLDMNERMEEGEHNRIFVGKTGSFCPVAPGQNGGLLVRSKDDKFYAVAGTKGYRFMEEEILRTAMNVDDLKFTDFVDISYFERLAEEAEAAISQYGDFEWFTKE